MTGFEPAKEYPPGKPLSDYESGVYASNFIVLAPVGLEPTPRDYTIVGQLLKACVYRFHHGAIVYFLVMVINK